MATLWLPASTVAGLVLFTLETDVPPFPSRALS